MPAARDVGRYRRVKVREHERRVPVRSQTRDTKSSVDLRRGEAERRRNAATTRRRQHEMRDVKAASDLQVHNVLTHVAERVVAGRPVPAPALDAALRAGYVKRHHGAPIVGGAIGDPDEWRFGPTYKGPNPRDLAFIDGARPRRVPLDERPSRISIPREAHDVKSAADLARGERERQRNVRQHEYRDVKAEDDLLTGARIQHEYHDVKGGADSPGVYDRLMFAAHNGKGREVVQLADAVVKNPDAFPTDVKRALNKMGLTQRDSTFAGLGHPQVIGPAHPDYAAQQQARFNESTGQVGGGVSNLLGPAQVIGAIGGSLPGIAGKAAHDLQLGPLEVVGGTIHGLQHPKEGFIDPIVQTFEHPLKSFKEHPLFTAQILHGGVSTVGRSVGALGRRVPGLSRRAPFDQRRAPLELSGGQGARSLHRERGRYSADAIRASAQRLYDAKVLRTVRDREGNPVLVDVDGKKMALKHPRTPAKRDRYLRELGNFIASAEISGLRMMRSGGVHKLRGAAPSRSEGRFASAVERRLPGEAATPRAKILQKLTGGRAVRPERDVVPLLLEGTVRPSTKDNPMRFVDDLKGELERLQKAYPKLEPRERKTNLQNQRAVARALADPKLSEEAATRSQRELADMQHENDDLAVKLGMGDVEAFRRAPLTVYAHRHHGARYVENPKPSEAAQATHESALRVLDDAQKGLSAAEEAVRKTTAQRHRIVGKHQSQRGRELAAGRTTAPTGKHAAEWNAYIEAAPNAAEATGRIEAAARAGVDFDAMKRHQARRGPERIGEAKRGEASPAAKRALARRAELVKADDALRAAKQTRKDARKRFADARQAARDATPNYRHGSIRAADGGVLTNEAILKLMREDDVDPSSIAFFPHLLERRGPAAYYQQFRPDRGRGTLQKQGRTLSLYERGAREASYEGVIEHILRTRLVLHRTQAIDRLVNEAVTAKPRSAGEADEGFSGGGFTHDEALRAADRRTSFSAGSRAESEPTMIPIRMRPRVSPEAKGKIDDALQDPSHDAPIDALVERIYKERTEAPRDAADRAEPNWGLIPKVLNDQILKQLEVSKRDNALFQSYVSLFRQTVLPFSTKWLAGNWIEAAVRTAAVAAGPNSARIARGTLNQLLARDGEAVGLRTIRDPSGKITQVGRGELRNRKREIAASGAKTPEEQAWFDIQSHMLGGLLYGTKGQTVHRTPEEIAGRAGGVIARMPVVQDMAQFYRAATGGIVAINRFMESAAETAVLGKFVHQQMQDFTGSWIKATIAQKKAVAEAAKGLVDTPSQHAFARYLDETLGQYSRFRPKIRGWTQTAAPFLPWYLNSLRFVFWTLPAHHPIKQGVLAAGEKAFQQDWEDQHKDAPPGSLRSAYRTAKGGYIDYAHYLPFGAFTGVFGGEFADVTSPLFPYAQGAFLALGGRDPFGRELEYRDKDTGGLRGPRGAEPLAQAGKELAEGSFPLIQLIRRMREHGETALAGSDVLHPETKGPESAQGQSALERVFNPFRPVYVKPSTPGRRKTRGRFSGAAGGSSGGRFQGLSAP